MREGSRAGFFGTRTRTSYASLVRRCTPPSTGETYHVYNRGAHKSDIFKDENDYRRFLLLMFLANGKRSLDMRGLETQYKGRDFCEMFEYERINKEFVDVLAYTLMPNHFHMIIRQKTDDGLATFMQKVATGYSMYFNLKYGHSGTIFQGRYKSSHVNDESYFRWIFSYVHLNPVALCDPSWEHAGVKDSRAVRRFLGRYPYSSYFDYCIGSRPESSILSRSETPEFVLTHNDLDDLLADLAKT